MHKVAKKLARPQSIQMIKLPTLSQYINGWSRAWESTSSSPLAVHFGHYMVGIQDLAIAKLNWLLATIPLKSGYASARWHRGLNVMLEKSIGNFDMEWLRIILLFKVDCNSNNKWLGWAFMRQAELSKALANELYSSHNSKTQLQSASTNGCSTTMFISKKHWQHCAPMMQRVVMTALSLWLWHSACVGWEHQNHLFLV